MPVQGFQLEAGEREAMKAHAAVHRANGCIHALIAEHAPKIDDVIRQVQVQVIASQHLNNGPHWLGLLVDEVDTVLALTPDHGALKQLGTKVGVTARRQAPGTGLIRRANREARAFAQAHASITQDPTDLEVRAFAAPVGIAEDPVTGSLNASLAQWLMADGHMPAQYSARQGTVLGRAGQVFLSQDAQGQVWVGGDVVSCITGSVTL